MLFDAVCAGQKGTFLRIPLSHFPLIRSMLGARRAGGWYRGTFGSENGSRYRGVSQLQSHQSRYSVQLRPAGRPLFVPPGVPGTSGRCPTDFLKFMFTFVPENSGKTPETLSERFLEFPSRARVGTPKTLQFKAFKASRAFPEVSPPSTAGGASFFQKWFRRGPLRAGHGIPSSTEGISDHYPAGRPDYTATSATKRRNTSVSVIILITIGDENIT